MLYTVLKSKLHNFKVTDANLHYQGSITLDFMLMDCAGIEEYEQVHVLNVDSGERIITYALKGDSGECCLNGAAAKLFNIGDEVIVLAYGVINKTEKIDPKIINVEKIRQVE